jgi:ribosome-binding protein aMBF1 (putative translation factor)
MASDKMFCSACGEWKAFNAFPASTQRQGGSDWCRACRNLNYVGKRENARDAEIAKGVEGNFAVRLRDARIARKLDKTGLAEVLNVTYRQVNMWEQGNSLPRQKKLLEIHEFFGWPIPLSAIPNEEGRLPVEIKYCANPDCGKQFPAYKARVMYCSRVCSDKIFAQNQMGENNPNWSGGFTHVSGYRKIKVGKGHPGADDHGYILEQRHVMQEKLGRPLTSFEYVHHKNGDRTDNRLENLELFNQNTNEGAAKDPTGIRASDYHCYGCQCELDNKVQQTINKESSKLDDVKKQLVLAYIKGLQAL